MTRAELADHLGLWYNGYLTEVGRAATDTPEGIRHVLDATLRALGHTGDLSAQTDDDDEGMRAWGEYLLLKWLVTDLGTRFNVSVSGSSYTLSQLYDHAKDALAAAELVVVGRYGSVIPGNGALGVIMVDLNMYASSRDIGELV